MQFDVYSIIYQLRFVYVGIASLVLLITASAIITLIGANTILDVRSHPIVVSNEPSLSDSPNAVTVSATEMLQQGRVGMINTGRAFYSTCRVTSTAAANSAKATGRGIATIVGGMWHGTLYVGKAIGNAVVFTAKLPGKVISPIVHANAVNSFMRPAESTETPAIVAQTSSEILEQYNADQKKRIAALQAAQLTANEKLGGSVLAGDIKHGGYPAALENVRQDSIIDSWGMYNRECVSYAAWKVHQTYDSMPYWGGVGNANQWVGNAKAAGIPTGYTPKVGSVAILMNGYYGHAMWVEAVSGDMIYVSQYNYDLHGHYSEMWVKSSGLTYIYFK